MKSGKRVMCAGPENPPVIVMIRQTLEKAAADIMAGATLITTYFAMRKNLYLYEKV